MLKTFNFFCTPQYKRPFQAFFDEFKQKMPHLNQIKYGIFSSLRKLDVGLKPASSCGGVVTHSLDIIIDNILQPLLFTATLRRFGAVSGQIPKVNERHLAVFKVLSST